MKLIRQTGRKDRKGVSIREGDVLNYYRDGNVKMDKRKIVKWCETTRYTGFNIGECKNYEVIGNLEEAK